jgi:hypothetical protein
MRVIASVNEKLSETIKHLESRQRILNHASTEFVADNFGLSKHEEIQRLLSAHKETESVTGTYIHPASRNQNLSREGKADDDCMVSLPKAQKLIPDSSPQFA